VAQWYCASLQRALSFLLGEKKVLGERKETDSLRGDAGRKFSGVRFSPGALPFSFQVGGFKIFYFQKRLQDIFL